MSPVKVAGPAGSRASTRLRLLVVHEAGLLREGLCALLETVPEIEVVGSALVGIDALKTAAALQAQLIVLGLREGSRSGLRLISTFKSQLPGLHVLVLTSHREATVLEGALRAGADAYLLESDSRGELFAAIAAIMGGKTFISPSLRGPAPSSGGRSGAPAPELTERELQVMRLIAAGHRTLEIARLLSLSHKTIEKHRTSLMRKLGLRNATAVAAYAITAGLAD